MFLIKRYFSHNVTFIALFMPSVFTLIYLFDFVHSTDALFYGMIHTHFFGNVFCADFYYLDHQCSYFC